MMVSIATNVDEVGVVIVAQVVILIVTMIVIPMMPPTMMTQCKQMITNKQRVMIHHQMMKTH
jgi:hypothetical protein